MNPMSAWYSLTPQIRAMVMSYVRVLGGCLVATYLLVVGNTDTGVIPDADALKSMLTAFPGALVVTVGNYFRKGDKRFGKGSEEPENVGDTTLADVDEPGNAAH